jgi:hypothetical protein
MSKRTTLLDRIENRGQHRTGDQRARHLLVSERIHYGGGIEHGIVEDDGASPAQHVGQ